MLKKTLRFVLKTFWFIIVLLAPTILDVIYFVIRSEVSNVVSVIFLYSMPIIFIVLSICIVLFIWKKPGSLFALSIGFLITLKLVPMVLSFLGGGYRGAYSGGFGGEKMATLLSGIFYAFPFAIITLFIAGLIVAKSLDEKYNNPPEIHESLPPQEDEES